MKDMHASTLERDLLCGYHNSILGSYYFSTGLYSICSVVFICADRWCPYQIKNLCSPKSH